MQTEKQKHIEYLLERFFDGQTSNAEEQVLYSFFTGPDVPEALRPYQAVFGYFETGIKNELNEPVTESGRFFRKSPVKKLFWTAACVAASLLAFLVYFWENNRPDPFNPYEGSYIVRNGVRITDMDKILPELEYTLREAKLQQEQAEQVDYQVNQKEKLLHEREVNATNPYRKILEENPNKYFRQEMKWIIYNE
ncbi:hypothetical protein [uncultured Parabacteroides sp.]|uniref:hypothetical protein n=1 Tax=uncultured Parabacteroides sp. TaxID=512312 RepID=UPI0025EE12E5|nr:hypothetical protein [uncultured Parabacteroides sp.]